MLVSRAQQSGLTAPTLDEKDKKAWCSVPVRDQCRKYRCAVYGIPGLRQRRTFFCAGSTRWQGRASTDYGLSNADLRVGMPCKPAGRRSGALFKECSRQGLVDLARPSNSISRRYQVDTADALKLLKRAPRRR